MFGDTWEKLDYSAKKKISFKDALGENFLLGNFRCETKIYQGKLLLLQRSVLAILYYTYILCYSSMALKKVLERRMMVT